MWPSIASIQLFFREEGLEFGPRLICGGIVLPCNHLVFGKHFTLPRLGTCLHCFFVIACLDTTVAEQDLETIKLGKVRGDACHGNCQEPCQCSQWWWQAPRSLYIPRFPGMDRPSPDLAHILANTNATLNASLKTSYELLYISCFHPEACPE